jgi:hypothetical protein
MEYPAPRGLGVEMLTYILTNRIFVSRMRKALGLPYCVHFQPRDIPVHRFSGSIVNSLGIVQGLAICLQLDFHPIGDIVGKKGLSPLGYFLIQ